ncbi:ATPase/histidine kinase/DNA gyrase B/HSP90 domain protein [Gleimia coleocanis DSM 15436]|uniref:histidine kinase n=1 Tax=Gleimia coleocanis DSM 15436 TaxID=525245 RepID=C0VYJ4_9ACTO|nr:HAMP domain-containing sensor histidine kinase [Gleimia coleocanis]EEH64497.1 ATPase/histidine kinase/DNA gyrase B/HSP90 domain protein [Gleimia coleocanis DSM 15436]
MATLLTSIANAWDNLSLRTRLVSLFTAVLTVCFAFATTAVLGILQSHLVYQLDSELQLSAKSLAVSASSSLLRNESTDIPTNYYVRIDSPNEASKEFINPKIAQRYGYPDEETLLPFGVIPEDSITTPASIGSSKTGAYWRAVAVPIATQDGTQFGVVTVALPLTGVSETLLNSVKYFGVLALVVIAVGATSAYYLVRRSLRPLQRIESVAAQIAAGDISQRIEIETPNTEVGSLSVSLNQMLTQIEQSFAQRDAARERIERFISDASHELRTPLATLQGYAQLYRIGGITPENIPDVMGRFESEANRMNGLVEDMLRLARLDEQRKVNPVPLDLTALAQTAAFDLRALDASRVVQVLNLGASAPLPASGSVSEGGLPELFVNADKDQVSQVFTNIISNIVRYTPKGTPVEIMVGRSDQWAVVEFRDHGPGISTEHQEKVFGRFYRVDKSRSRESGGSGLGLSIVSAVMALHAGKASIVTTPGGGVTVRLSFPLPKS